MDRLNVQPPLLRYVFCFPCFLQFLDLIRIHADFSYLYSKWKIQYECDHGGLLYGATPDKYAGGKVPSFNVSVCSYGVPCLFTWTIVCIVIDLGCQVLKTTFEHLCIWMDWCHSDLDLHVVLELAIPRVIGEIPSYDRAKRRRFVFLIVLSSFIRETYLNYRFFSFYWRFEFLWSRSTSFFICLITPTMRSLTCLPPLCRILWTMNSATWPNGRVQLPSYLGGTRTLLLRTTHWSLPSRLLCSHSMDDISIQIDTTFNFRCRLPFSYYDLFFGFQLSRFYFYSLNCASLDDTKTFTNQPRTIDLWQPNLIKWYLVIHTQLFTRVRPSYLHLRSRSCDLEFLTRS